MKDLPEVFAKDEARLARFEREAKLLAALNHPGIATLYEVAPGGQKFLFRLPAGSDEPITVVLNWKTILRQR